MANQSRSEAPSEEANGKRVRRKNDRKKQRSSIEQPRQFQSRGTEVRKG